MDYFLTYDEHSYTITEPEPNPDNEPYMDQGSSGVDVYPRTLHLSKPSGPHEAISSERRYGGMKSFPIETLSAGDSAYVVIVTYSDGDTFGSSGYWKVAAVCSTPEQAKTAEERAQIPEPRQIGGDDWMPWHGYFAHLKNVETYPMVVLA